MGSPVNEKTLTVIRILSIAVTFHSFINGSATASQSYCDAIQPAKACNARSTWFEVGASFWQLGGRDLPPLATTSPPGVPRDEAGELGRPSTLVLFGGEAVNDDFSAGIELSGGHWIDPCQRFGFEFSYLSLVEQIDDFSAISAGDPILAVPFFNVSSGAVPQEDAFLVAFPGQATGALAIDTSSEFHTSEVSFRRRIFRHKNCGTDWIAGYRFMRLDESLGLRANSLVVNPAPATIDLFDSFKTENQFHGLQLGLRGDYCRGRAWIESAAKVAFGASFGETNISGATTIATAGAVIRTPGGLFSQITNIGRYTDSDFAGLCELQLRGRYFLAKHVWVHGGYRMMIVSDVLRVADQIDRGVNLNIGTPPFRPQFVSDNSVLFAHGFSIGLTLAL